MNQKKSKRVRKPAQVSCMNVPLGEIRELTWFCKNVAGVRNDMYSTIEQVEKFNARIERLETTCRAIDKFFKRLDQQSKRAKS